MRIPRSHISQLILPLPTSTPFLCLGTLLTSIIFYEHITASIILFHVALFVPYQLLFSSYCLLRGEIWWMGGGGVAGIVQRNAKFTLKLKLLIWHNGLWGPIPFPLHLSKSWDFGPNYVHHPCYKCLRTINCWQKKRFILKILECLIGVLFQVKFALLSHDPATGLRVGPLLATVGEGNCRPLKRKMRAAAPSEECAKAQKM